jgi:hypothetical protein
MPTAAAVVRSPQSGLVDKDSRNMGKIREFMRKCRRKFSAIQTAWRRERDSNPRYGFPHSGFQDHPFQPLTHPSARESSGDYSQCTTVLIPH